jgi:Spy/CpxP family protein refolding chaperone
MKKLILSMLAAMIASASLLAQEPMPEPQKPQKSPQERADNMTNRMAKELGLTADQKEKVHAIILKREIERDKAIDEMKKDREAVEAELKTILNAEQFKKFEEKKKEIVEKRKENRKERLENAPPPPPKDK